MKTREPKHFYNAAEFEKELNRDVGYISCVCGASMMLSIKLPVYGGSYVYLTCPHCKKEIRYPIHSLPLFAPDKFGTPCTPECITDAICNVITTWNDEKRNMLADGRLCKHMTN